MGVPREHNGFVDFTPLDELDDAQPHPGFDLVGILGGIFCDQRISALSSMTPPSRVVNWTVRIPPLRNTVLAPMNSPSLEMSMV